MNGLESLEAGKRNEERIANRYRKKGYTILDTNTKGFSDLIVLKGHNIEFFVEAKDGKHKVHSFQETIHKKLEEMGFEVRVERIQKAR